MKLTLFLLIAGIIGAQAETYSQSRLNITIQNGDLRQVFQQIHDQTDFLVLYKDALIESGSRKITLNLKDKTVQEVLQSSLKGTGLTFRISGRQITIVPRNNSASRLIPADSLLTIRGRVYDTHEPPGILPGVTVKVKNSNTGVISDADGYFTIKAKKNDVLVFTMISFQPAEHLVLKSERSLIISLKEDISSLEEVVVVGLNEQQKKHIASSLAKLDVESNITGKPITTLSQSLQGGVTGLQVSQASGLPGGDAATIKIRGISTLGNSNPLVLVDGIPMDMNHIDPNTVESVTVLKDAAAASIYGARAANGVILVATKRGVPGKVAVSYDGYYGSQTASTLPQTVDAPQYMRMLNEAQINAGNPATYTTEQIENTANGLDPVTAPNTFANTNWVDLIVDKAAPITSHSLSVSGGSSVARFAVTGNYIDQKGIIPLSGMQRYNIRANTTISLSDKLQINLDLLAIRRNTTQPNRTTAQDNVGNRLLEDIYRVPPVILPKYPEKEGRTFYGQFVDIVNPLAYAEVGGIKKSEFGQTSINLQPRWEVFRNFNLRGQFSFRLNSDVNRDTRDNFNHFDYYSGQLLRTWGLSRAISLARGTYYYIGSTADYSLKLNDHSIFVMGGYSQEETNSGSWDVFSMMSAYTKVNYSFKDKYLLEGTLRADGSSRFGPGNKFGYFPSVAVGWNLHKERLLQNLKFVNNLKLRASYGQLGNENIGLYMYQTVIAPANGVESTYGNPNITWETVNMLDIGMDLGLFKNSKLELTIDYYNKLTKDIILNPPLPMAGGFQGNVPVNAGEVRNRGWELSLNYNENLNKNTSISFRPGVTVNKNTIVKLLGGPYIDEADRINAANPTNRFDINQEGSSINSIYGFKSNGLLQASDFDGAGNALVPVRPGQKPGDIRYLDISNDGIINDSDQTLIGNPTPNLNYFANFSISYKKFDFEFLLQGVGKNDAILLDMFALPLDMSRDGGVPTTYYADKYWTPERTNARFPRLNTNPVNNKVTSDFWFQNGAYTRVKYIQLGYNFNSTAIRKMGINAIRVYANAQNPLTFTSVKITDPESRGNQWTYGIVKLYTLGMNVKF